MEKTAELKVLNNPVDKSGSIKTTDDLISDLEIEQQKEEIQKMFGESNLISIEVLRKPDEVNTSEEAEEFYKNNTEVKNYLILDTEKKYIIRLTTAKKGIIQSVDPDYIPGGDMYEVSESIQDILKENGFPVFKYKFPERTEADND